MHTAPYFTAFGLMAIYLSARVVTLRARNKLAFGDGGIAELARAVRTFGNFIEYVPLGLILLSALEFVQAPVWFLHLCGGLMLVGRILHVIALDKASLPARTAGMALTYTSLAFASVGVTAFTLIGPR